jgi:ankyrin repeat protein
MLADGDARITDVDQDGYTALLHAATGEDSLPTLIWLLEEGGARITDRTRRGSGGSSALLLAAMYGRMTTCRWLLEHGGADIAEVDTVGLGVWHML